MCKETIEIPVWYRINGMMYRRSALPLNHPESEYNYIKNTLKLAPEDYGVYNSKLASKLAGKTKEELEELSELVNDIISELKTKGCQYGR